MIATERFTWNASSLLGNYNPSQPRDSKGRWGSGGGGAMTPDAEGGLGGGSGKEIPEIPPYVDKFGEEPMANPHAAFRYEIYQNSRRAVESYLRGDPPLASYTEGDHTAVITRDRQTVFIKEGDPLPAPSGQWMGFWDVDLGEIGVSKEQYRKMGYEQKAAVDAEVQAKKYAAAQFERLKDEFWGVPKTENRSTFDPNDPIITHPFVWNARNLLDNYSNAQPRDSRGRWSSGGGGGGFSGKGGEFDPAAAQRMSVPDRVNAWEKLPVRTRDELADAENSVPKRISEHLSGLPDRPNTGDLAADLDARCEHFKDRLIPESQEKVKATVRDFNETLKAANIPEEARRALAMEAADHLAAQDLESYGRQLGDHGIHHIQGNIEAAKDCLNVLPQEMSPKDYAVMQTAMIFHDAGYLTPPSQNFLDEGHPRWSQDHYEANVRPIVESALGKSAASEISSIIRTHDQSSLDWENEPVASACRVADNMALFQKEKLPPVFRADADNVEALKALGRGEIDQTAARARMKANVAKLDLPDQAKEQLTKAVDEVTPVTYKFTIGMLGGTRGKMEWDNDHLKVELRRDKSMDELHKLGDFGQKQFAKFAKSYGIDPEQFTRDLNFKVEGARGKTLLEAVVNRLMGCLILGDFPPVFNEDEWVDNYSNAQPRDDHGRWSSGGGGGLMAPDTGGGSGGSRGKVGVPIDPRTGRKMSKKALWSSQKADEYVQAERVALEMKPGKARKEMEEVARSLERELRTEGEDAGYHLQEARKRNEETVFFHGTTKEAAEAILKEGLKPGAREGATAWAEKLGIPFQEASVGGRNVSVFISSNKADARKYELIAKKVTGKKTAILKITVPKDQLKNLKDDEKHFGAKRFEGTIPPDWITLNAEGIVVWIGVLTDEDADESGKKGE